MRGAGHWVVLLLVAASNGHALPAQCNDCPDKRIISVNGTGVVTADADVAIVRVGYKLYGPDAKVAYATAVDTSNAIMTALTGSGIPRSAIESTSQILQHTQPYELQQLPYNSVDRAQREFTVTQSWVIRVKPDEAARALNTAITAGANESGWIEWTVNNPGVFQARASAIALENARQIAQQIADQSKVRLGHLVSVNENDGSGAFMLNGAIGGNGMGTGAPMGGPVQIGNQQLVINSRRIEFKIIVNAVFSIE